MKNKKHRFFCFLLALILIFSVVLILPVGASAGEKYFVFEALQDAQGTAYPAASEPLSLSLDGGTSFSCVDLSLLAGETNALYISLVNRSVATKIRISYVYEIYGVTSSESVEYALASQSSQAQSFVVAAPYLDTANGIKEMEISFVGEGALSGNVDLLAFFNISTYVKDTNVDATFSRCHYNEKTGEIELQGSLSYAATVRYEGESLALFALSEGEDLHLSSKTPVARTDISFNFSFTVAATGAEALFSRYVVAAVTAKGERIPLCTPAYPSLATAQIPKEEGFKGFLGNEMGEAVDVLPDVSVVDVHLERLFGSQSDGILYAGEYDYYYFDQNYIAQLDARIHNLIGIGAHVYLRLLVDGKSAGISFVDTAPDGVKNRLPVVRTKQAQRDLFAVIDFISARYAKEDVISGLILGRAADLLQTYSYCAAANMAEYSTLYASTLNLVAGAARRNIPTLRVMLPVSDRVFAESVTALQSTNDYYGALLIPSLLGALESQILDPQPIGIFLESGGLTHRVGGEEERFFGTDGLPALLADLQSAAKSSPYLSTEIFFSWQPPAAADETQLRADYLLKYASLFQNGTVSTFVLDLSAQSMQKECEKSLIHLAKYVNTDRFDAFCAGALEAIGLQGLSELYPQGLKLSERRVFSTELSLNAYADAHDITGSYVFWDFSAATDPLGWYVGSGCRAISIVSAENGAHALLAQCRAQGGYADISYHFDNPVNLSFAPLLCMELGVSGAAGTRYEVQLRLIGEGSVTYAGAVVTGGESQRLCLDLSQNTVPVSLLRNVRVLVRPLDTENADFDLSLSTFTLESTTLSNEALAERIHEIRENTAQQEHTAQARRDYTLPLAITGGIALLSILVSAVLILVHRIKRKRENFIKKENRKE